MLVVPTYSSGKPMGIGNKSNHFLAKMHNLMIILATQLPSAVRRQLLVLIMRILKVQMLVAPTYSSGKPMGIGNKLNKSLAKIHKRGIILAAQLPSAVRRQLLVLPMRILKVQMLVAPTYSSGKPMGIGNKFNKSLAKIHKREIILATQLPSVVRRQLLVLPMRILKVLMLVVPTYSSGKPVGIGNKFNNSLAKIHKRKIILATQLPSAVRRQLLVLIVRVLKVQMLVAPTYSSGKLMGIGHKFNNSLAKRHKRIIILAAQLPSAVRRQLLVLPTRELKVQMLVVPTYSSGKPMGIGNKLNKSLAKIYKRMIILANQLLSAARRQLLVLPMRILKV